MKGTTYDSGGPSPSSVSLVSDNSQARPIDSDISLSTEHAKVIQLFEAGLLRDADIEQILNTDIVID
jgi:hypothetical protein